MCILFLFPIQVFALNDTARSSIVMDINSGRILYENNANEQRLIASITKIMTAVIALENGKLDDIVTAGDEILKMYGTSIYIEHNEKMRLEDLLYGLMLRSGNDAAVVIAKHISGSEEEFVKMMNEKAKQLGMTNTIFKNAHGLDEETKNYSTAKDMAILSSYAYKNFKEYRKISKTKKKVVQTENKTYLWYNRNKLLNSYEYCTGGKNGYTPSAGKTLVTTAKKDNLEITIVTLKDNDEYNNHKNLAETTFQTYHNYSIVDKKSFVIEDPKTNSTYYIKDSFSYPLTEEEAKKVSILASIDKTIQKGKVGNVKVKFKEKELTSIPIYSKQEKTKKGFFANLFG